MTEMFQTTLQRLGVSDSEKPGEGFFLLNRSNAGRTHMFHRPASYADLLSESGFKMKAVDKSVGLFLVQVWPLYRVTLLCAWKPSHIITLWLQTALWKPSSLKLSYRLYGGLEGNFLFCWRAVCHHHGSVQVRRLFFNLFTKRIPPPSPVFLTSTGRPEVGVSLAPLQDGPLGVTQSWNLGWSSQPAGESATPVFSVSLDNYTSYSSPVRRVSIDYKHVCLLCHLTMNIKLGYEMLNFWPTELECNISLSAANPLFFEQWKRGNVSLHFM